MTLQEAVHVNWVTGILYPHQVGHFSNSIVSRRMSGSGTFDGVEAINEPISSCVLGLSRMACRLLADQIMRGTPKYIYKSVNTTAFLFSSSFATIPP